MYRSWLKSEQQEWLWLQTLKNYSMCWLSATVYIGAPFWAPFRTVSWRPNFNRTWCPGAKTIAHKPCKKKKKNNIRDCELQLFTSPTTSPARNSCHKVVSALAVYYTWLLTSAKTLSLVPLRSGCTCQHICVLRWPEAWSCFWRETGRFVHNVINTVGRETTITVF